MVEAFGKLFAIIAFGSVVALVGGSIVAADPCDRAAFGRWRVIDGLDTRAQILDQRSIAPVVWNTAGTRVVRGSWQDRFTGHVFENIDARKVHIDHLVPVCWAWDHGAEDWTRAKRKKFFNDPRFLLVVEARANTAKGDAGPDQVLPMNRHFACEYVERFLFAIELYELTLSAQESIRIWSTKDAACRPHNSSKAPIG
ncbi:GmrSD restriction endonuclease domain-containing protein [Shimia abyssi]|nr:DUF1524 domain-containing protein [Shimia abyssi]